MKVATVNVTSWPSTNDATAPITKTAAGAPNGNRRHQRSGASMITTSGTAIQSEIVGAAFSSRMTMTCRPASIMPTTTRSVNHSRLRNGQACSITFLTVLQCHDERSGRAGEIDLILEDEAK